MAHVDLLLLIVQLQQEVSYSALFYLQLGQFHFTEVIFSEDVALEQGGKHLVYALGKFRMDECSCYGLSWFVWEADKKNQTVGWLRLKSTNRVLTVLLEQEAHGQRQFIVNLDEKDANDNLRQKWLLSHNSSNGGYQIISTISQQKYFLAITTENKLVAQNDPKSKLNTIWMIKEGTYK